MVGAFTPKSLKFQVTTRQLPFLAALQAVEAFHGTDVPVSAAATEPGAAMNARAVAGDFAGGSCAWPAQTHDHAAAQSRHGDDWRGDAVGWLVRLQRRLGFGGQRSGSDGDHGDAPVGRRQPVLGRVGAIQVRSRLADRPCDRHHCRSGLDHARLGLCRPCRGAVYRR